MKMPNGEGSITKLSGKRRKPYAIRITTGWDLDNSKQIKKYIGYYETKTEAIEALALYKANPYNIETNKITFSEVYDRWSSIKFESVGNQAIIGYNSIYKLYCKDLYGMPFCQIKTDTLNKIISSIPTHYSTKKKAKNLFNQLFKYAMENDIVAKNYAEFIATPKKDATIVNREIFTEEEINKLFKASNVLDFADTILIMIYTGIRIGELLTIKNKNINLKDRYFTCGIKTEAGKDRLIPINNKILPFFENRISDKEYFITNFKGEQMKYDNYKREKFNHIMEQLGMEHNPHDCRHTFATMLYKAEANKTSIKKIIGHSSYITTEKIYTHTDIEDLKKAVDLL